MNGIMRKQSKEAQENKVIISQMKRMMKMTGMNLSILIYNNQPQNKKKEYKLFKDKVFKYLIKKIKLLIIANLK